MKMSYEKPEIEVRNYSLLQDVSCGLSYGGDVYPGPADAKSSDELFSE